MTSLKTECRKFSPNIFNKSKCQNCFRGKDAHSTEALESNRATRKVSCCGYLFVAPDWDFSLPINRNKRWQRRWFVLYDDGELAYSVDEHPETVPQAIIDMNCVLEVSDAEAVTGNPFALSVTCPDKVHFIKGMSKDESKKWFEVLSKFPRTTVCGKYKRNSTFPCIKPTAVPKIENSVNSVHSRKDSVDSSNNYTKHNGYVNSLNRSNLKQNSSIVFDPEEDVYPTKDTNSTLITKTQEKLLIAEDKKNSENAVVRNEMNCLRKSDSAESAHFNHGLSRFLLLVGLKSDIQKQIMSWSEEQNGDIKTRSLHKSASVPNAAAILREDKILINCLSNKLSSDSLERKPSFSQIRGVPDGCNPDSVPSHCTSSVEFNGDQSNENTFLKKGWLVKQDECKWNKYWFVLRNSALTYFSDPIAEDAGILDGFIDLRKAKSVVEAESSSGYTFCIIMKDFSNLYLSAVTAKIRNNWIQAIFQAANLKLHSEEKFTKHNDDLKTVSNRSKSSTPCPDICSSSIESEKGSPTSASKLVVEEEDPEKHQSLPLPPSPPLARTVISRVKEKARTRSNSRTRCSKIRSDVHESDPHYLGDSDDGTTDHSSSSLPPTSTRVSHKEKKQSKVESSIKSPEEKTNRPERRRSFKLSSLDSLTFPEGRKKVTDIKDKLEDSSWTIWLDISKFCKEVESKLDDIEVKTPKNGPHLSGDQKKEIGVLVSSLGRVEDRLHRVQSELEKAKVNLLLNTKDGDISLSSSKGFGCHSLKQEVTRLSGISSQNVLLAQQLNKVREENRRLKSEVKIAQTSSDDFELRCISLKQACEQAEKLHKAHMELMIARVDDLTDKLLNSEKNVRQLRQRVMKLEQRQERRRSSLKGKEGLSLSKEYEAKLTELEQKIGAVEGVLKTSNGENGKEESSKDTQSLLMRLHNLDKKVKDVTETVSTAEEVKQEDMPKPKICLQVNMNENTPCPDMNENWNSLSLSASMTDLTSAESAADEELSLSFAGCLESLGHKVSSLVLWLKTSLQLLYAQGHINPFQPSKVNFISSEESEELSKLVRTLDHVTNKLDEPPPQDVNLVVKKLLYNIILLQEVTNVVFKMSDFEKYKTSILVQHLIRVKQAIIGIETYIHQKSSLIQPSLQKVSLCNIVACLLFYQSNSEEIDAVTDVRDFFDDVDQQRRKVCGILAEFKEKFIERFCTTVLELSEDSVCDKASNQKSPDQKPLGQKQFLSHISHIISQVSHSFIAHISKSLNEVYFLCSSIQNCERWTDYICKLLQQELSLLSSEIKSICVKHLENNFFSSSKCGVLVEYMHCSISELAQIVSIITVVDGTVILIKDAIYSDCDRSKQSTQNNALSSADKQALTTFHENLQVRAMNTMSNLPLYRFPNSFFNLCNPNELNVAHRSVSSLLCFKRKWKASVDADRQEYRSQLDLLTAKLAALQEEQKKRLEEGCKSCIELRQEVSYLQAELDESRVLARTGSLCEKCRNLRVEIQHLMEQHEKDLTALEKLEENEMVWKTHLEEILREKEKQYSEEKQKLEADLQIVQQNLKKMENHYSGEIHNLHNMYEQQKNEIVRDETIRLRYSEEIEQLKMLCEKGLSAMDVSHKKIIAELEERHERELDELMADREKALAQEAQATAVALEAVRKAHSDELQSFKEEFVIKMNKRFETEAVKKCYESDLSSVKHEILSMTEKYSVKCLENATLHEKLEIMNHHLKSTTTQVVELLAKNQELQARLTSVGYQKQEEAIL
ncbi:protein outspread [Parasteatoda tepidariorum]